MAQKPSIVTGELLLLCILLPILSLTASCVQYLIYSSVAYCKQYLLNCLCFDCVRLMPFCFCKMDFSVEERDATVFRILYTGKILPGK